MRRCGNQPPKITDPGRRGEGRMADEYSARESASRCSRMQMSLTSR
jgi:hypothetical protein